VIGASLESGSGVTFGEAAYVRMTLRRSSDAEELLVFVVNDASTELALVIGEFYRRQEAWRFRAVGQGYEGGLSDLIKDFGVEVDSADPESPRELDGAPDTESGVPPTQPIAAPGVAVIGADGPDTAGGGAAGDVSPMTSDADPALTAQRVSVRRAAHPPRMPADWDATVPAGDEDWQPARLFPVAAIGVGEEQERRATSALLAVMSTVREFGRALITGYGAPAGPIQTFVEVPFGHDEQAYRPDGVIRVTRAGRDWTALVEVKTSDAKLAQAQVDTYVDIARARNFDAVITVSNQLVGGADDSPVLIDRRKLKKVGLHHLSWDEIRTEATLLVKRRGLVDPTQRRVLEEFIRYMRHPPVGDAHARWTRLKSPERRTTTGDNRRGHAEPRQPKLDAQ